MNHQDDTPTPDTPTVLHASELFGLVRAFRALPPDRRPLALGLVTDLIPPRPLFAEKRTAGAR
jgi:hypothetical protein